MALILKRREYFLIKVLLLMKIQKNDMICLFKKIKYENSKIYHLPIFLIADLLLHRFLVPFGTCFL